MKLIQKLALASLFVLSFTPAAHATSYDFDDLDEIMPMFGWEEAAATVREQMPT
jgi:hypothetical protein